MHSVFSPYRVCPLGAHIDHQWGIVTGFALDKGVTLSFSLRSDSIIVLDSINFPGHVCFDLRGFPDKEGNWGDYARAAAFSLLRKGYSLEKGFSGVIEGTIPIGGLSSSAAVILCYMKALMLANNITLADMQLVDYALFAENTYIGLNNGKLDQSCEVLCKKQNLLVLDTRSDEYYQIPKNPIMPETEMMVIYSGLSRNLGKGYNMRVDEAKSASYCLKAFSGMEYGTYKDSRLRDVPSSVFKEYGDKLPENFKKRADHYYSEMERVEKGIEAWKKGDIVAFGQLMFESGYSSIYSWETGCPELKAIYTIMKETDGVYGGRFSGAGFKDCCVGLIDPTKREAIKESVTNAYLSLFPEYRDVFEIHFCHTVDGVRVR